jgi:Flp pilus assembly protein TadD
MNGLKFGGVFAVVFLAGLAGKLLLGRNPASADPAGLGLAKKVERNPGWDPHAKNKHPRRVKLEDVGEGEVSPVEALKSGDFGKAFDFFDKAVTLDPKDGFFRYGRGLCHAAKKDYGAAVRDYDDAIRLENDHSEYYLARAHAYAELKNYRQARADLDEALRLDPDSPEVYSARGHVYEKEGEYDQAVSDYEKALKLEDEDPNAYNELAWLYAACPLASLRDGERAVEYATKACEMSDWRDPEFEDTLAAAYAEVGRFDEAVKLQKKVLEAPPKEYDATDLAKARARLQLYEQKKPYRLEN